MTEKFFYSKVKNKITRPDVIEEFIEIVEFGRQKYLNIRPKSLNMHFNEGIEICYVNKGRYEWNIGDKCYHLLPGDGFITCPWEFHGSLKEIADWGEIYWLVIAPEIFKKDGTFKLSPWTRFNSEESKQIGRTIAFNTNPVIPDSISIRNLFNELHIELENKPLGYKNRIFNILENLFILVTRKLQQQYIVKNENLDWVHSLEEYLKSTIAKKWSVKNMASSYKMGTTSFNLKIKNLTGFTPSSLLINLRIERARMLLSTTGKNLTDIALECGFNSSQHFSSTFLKRTGEPPSKYRKKIKAPLII